MYGTGRQTSLVLSCIDDMNFIGLTDKDEELIGTTKYDLPIMGKEEVGEKTDMVIICTSRGHWSTIYNRIKGWKISIFYADGTRPDDEEKVDESDKYWDINEEYIKEKIKKYEVVIFDIFEYYDAIVPAFRKFRAPFSGKAVHTFPEQSAVI